MTRVAMTAGAVCQDCAHFTRSPGLARDGWEAALGAAASGRTGFNMPRASRCGLGVASGCPPRVRWSVKWR